jgi:7-cyano-7-deazaguanine synthase
MSAFGKLDFFPGIAVPPPQFLSLKGTGQQMGERILTDTNYDPGFGGSDGVAIVSGGMDSVTMTHLLFSQGKRPHMLSFDYGQRHKKELDSALWTAEQLGLRWSLIDLSSLTDLIATSALTSKDNKLEIGGLVTGSSIDVPEGHYSADNMAITVVPNRNMMMLSIAGAVAVSNKYDYLAAGMHAGDHAQYPDCREDFVDAFIEALVLGNEGFIKYPFGVLTPFIDASKNDIADFAYRLGVPLDKTWSCYKGGVIHCGRCGTCVERLEAIDSVDAPDGWDRTQYADKAYWREAVAQYKDGQ